MALLNIQNFCFQYPDGRKALQDVSISIAPGEKVGLVGLNGAGKSTLLLAICGVLKGAGKIEVNGVGLQRGNIVEIRKQVGLVFQDPNDQLFMPTVKEEVEFGLRNLGLPGNLITIKVAEALEKVGLKGVEKRITQHLSFGEKKRIAIASIIAMDPELLLLDEPTSNLDPKHRRLLIQILENLPQTFLVATHDLDLVGQLCSRVILMEEGRVTASFPKEEIQTDKYLRKLGVIA